MTHRPPIDLATDRDPWERQTYETPKQYARFRTFLELGRTRNLKQARETLNSLGDTVSQGQLYSISYTYRWVERAEAYDRDQDKLDRQRLLDAHREMIDRHRRIARGLFARALRVLEATEPGAVKPGEMVQMMRLAAELERRAIGEPTQITVSGPGGGPVAVEDFSRYGPEERRARLQEVVAELARRAGGSVAEADEIDVEDD